MRDDREVKAKVSRLLKVLVAGGVALAGVSATRAAEDAAPAASQEKPAPAEKAEKGKAKDASHQKTDAKKDAEKKKPQDEKKADEGGGVKGW